jgi:tetratricopeptide (TPR) repeat protein
LGQTVRPAVILSLVLWVCAFLVWGPALAQAQITEADVFVAQAILAYDGKRYPEALSLLNDALKIEPDNVQALYYSGLVHLAQKNPDRAVQFLEKSLKQSPTDPIIRYQLGVAYFTLEQYDKAEPLLASVFKDQPRLENLGYYVGFMRYRQKDYQGAVNAFRTGASTDPTMQQLTKFYAGLALGILGLSERAIVEVEEALRIQPASPLTGPAERIRDTIVKAREREQRLRAEIRIGGFYTTTCRSTPSPAPIPPPRAYGPG